MTVFVFGSDLASRHGKDIGRQGNSYAIPTKDEKIRTLRLNEIGYHVNEFLKYAENNKNETFQVTKIGCGLAGYSEKIIAPLFRYAPENCILPKGWVKKRADNRIVVAGSRSVKSKDIVFRVLDDLDLDRDRTVVLSGGAVGVDRLGEYWATQNGIEVDIFKAPWEVLDVPDAIIKTNKYGKKYNVKAGYLRNVWMGVCATSGVVIVRDNSSGSKHMIQYLKRIKKTVIEITV